MKMEREDSSIYVLSRVEKTGKISEDLKRIVDWMSKLKALELPASEFFYPPYITIKRRKDVARIFEKREKLLKLAPELKNGLFKVPRVI